MTHNTAAGERRERLSGAAAGVGTQAPVLAPSLPRVEIIPHDPQTIE
jgi:hypothetical protein